jgi:hypothetical protein
VKKKPNATRLLPWECHQRKRISRNTASPKVKEMDTEAGSIAKCNKDITRAFDVSESTFLAQAS